MPSDLARSGGRLSSLRWPAIIGLTVYFGFFYFQILHRILDQNHQSDFYHFYAATVAMSHGEDPYLSGTQGYVYPPLLAFLYLPLAHVSHTIAAAIALTINVYLMLAALLVGTREAELRLIEHDGQHPTVFALLPVAALLTAALTFGRVKAELEIMQTDVIVLAMYIFAICLLDRRPTLAGIALGFAMNIKYYTLPGLLYFLLRRRWSAAGGFVSATIFFALLPALRVGLSTDLQYMSIASGGVLKSIGVQTGQLEAAHVHHVYDALSVSITSGFARIFRFSRPRLTMPLVGVVILLFTLLVGIWYRTRKLPFILWPPANAQTVSPFSALCALEWAGLMIASIVFSPDSNLRHMVLVLFTNSIAAVLLLAGRDRVSKLPMIIVLALQIFAFDGIGHIHSPKVTDAFFFVGAQGWCILVFYAVILWAGLREICIDRTSISR